MLELKHLERLRKYFKYIPISNGGIKAFVDLENQILYESKSKSDTFDSVWTVPSDKPSTKSKKGDSKTPKEFFIKRSKNKGEDLTQLCLSHFDESLILDLVKVKVIGWVESARYFRYKEAKRELLSKEVEIKDVEFGLQVKEGKETVDVASISLKGEEKAHRFILHDLAFVYPNFNGYNTPKDRTIKKGSEVKVIYDQKLHPLTKGDVGVVQDLALIGQKVFANIEFKDKGINKRINIKNCKLNG